MNFLLCHRKLTFYDAVTGYHLLLTSKRIYFNKNQAFTLIELIVVIALISIMLAFAIPRLDSSFFSNNKRKLSSWILLNVKSLKEKAVREQVKNILAVDIDNNQMWIFSEPVSAEFAESPESDDAPVAAPEKNEYKLPDGYRLMDVEFLNNEKMTSGIAEIHFYPQGYSDKALIHIEDRDENRYSYLIESFLLHVKIEALYVDF